MSLQPEKMREIIFLMLFGMTHHTENSEKDLMRLVMDELKVSRSAARDGYQICQQILTSLPEIDAMITKVSTSFAFDRIQDAEMTILRISFWEMFVQKSLPPKVILSEAKRLTKKFAGDEGVKFVHALLINNGVVL